jgi:hypothetical protein
LKHNWQGNRQRKLLTITVELAVFQAIEDIKAGYEYPNRSALASDLLKAGLQARGIKLEA